MSMMLMPSGRNMIWVYIIMALYFVIGTCQAIRLPAGYCLLLDFLPNKHHSWAGSLMFIIESSTYIYQCLHFMFVNSNAMAPQTFSIF